MRPIFDINHLRNFTIARLQNAIWTSLAIVLASLSFPANLDAADFRFFGTYGFLSAKAEEFPDAARFEATLVPNGGEASEESPVGIALPAFAPSGTTVFIGAFPELPPGDYDLNVRAFDSDNCPAGNLAIPNAIRFAPRRLDVALVLDDSFSMRHTDPDRLRVEAANVFARIAATRGDIATISIVAFSRRARLLLPPTPPSDSAAISSALEQLAASGSTDLDAALILAVSELDRLPADSRKAIVVLSDGRDEPGDYANAHVRCALRHWPVHTIGLSDDIDADTLDLIARSTSGTFHRADSTEELASAFASIARDLHRSVSIGEWRVTADSETTIPVDDTIKSLSISLLDESPNAACSLVDPSGTARSLTCLPGSIDFATELFAPPPGQWSLRGLNGDAVLSVMAASDLELIAFPIPDEIHCGDAIMLSCVLPHAGHPMTNATVEATLSLLQDGNDAATDIPLGFLLDDGTNGDASPNDGIYTLAFQTDSIASGMIHFRASATTPAGFAFTRHASAPIEILDPRPPPNLPGIAWLSPSISKSLDFRQPVKPILPPYTQTEIAPAAITPYLGASTHAADTVATLSPCVVDAPLQSTTGFQSIPSPAELIPPPILFESNEPAGPRYNAWHIALLLFLIVLAIYILVRWMMRLKSPQGRMVKYFALSTALHALILLLTMDLLVQTRVVELEEISPGLAVSIEAFENATGMRIAPPAPSGGITAEARKTTLDRIEARIAQETARREAMAKLADAEMSEVDFKADTSAPFPEDSQLDAVQPDIAESSLPDTEMPGVESEIEPIETKTVEVRDDSPTPRELDSPSRAESSTPHETKPERIATAMPKALEVTATEVEFTSNDTTHIADTDLADVRQSAASHDPLSADMPSIESQPMAVTTKATVIDNDNDSSPRALDAPARASGAASLASYAQRPRHGIAAGSAQNALANMASSVDISRDAKNGAPLFTDSHLQGVESDAPAHTTPSALSADMPTTDASTSSVAAKQIVAKQSGDGSVQAPRALDAPARASGAASIASSAQRPKHGIAAGAAQNALANMASSVDISQDAKNGAPLFADSHLQGVESDMPAHAAPSAISADMPSTDASTASVATKQTVAKQSGNGSAQAPRTLAAPSRAMMVGGIAGKTAGPRPIALGKLTREDDNATEIATAATSMPGSDDQTLAGPLSDIQGGDFSVRFGLGGHGTVHATLGLAQYGGDWDCARSAMMFLGHQLRERTHMAFNASDSIVRLDDPAISKLPFVYMTGHNDFHFTDAEVANLRAYLLGGGHLWADDSTHFNDDTFDRAFRREVARILPEAPLARLGPDFAAMRTGYDLTNGYKGYAIPPGDKYRQDHIEGVMLGNRAAVIYTRNDYGDGLNIDAHTHPLKVSLTDLSPAEMQEGATRMGINLALYFITGGGTQGAEFVDRTSATLRSAKDASVPTAPEGPTRTWPAFESKDWKHEDWSDAGERSVADGTVTLDFTLGANEKSAFSATSVETFVLAENDVLAMDVESELHCAARIAIGMEIDGCYFESAPAFIKPGKNIVALPCGDATFKTEAGGWNHTDRLPFPAKVTKYTVLIYSPAAGRIKITNARIVSTEDRK